MYDSKGRFLLQQRDDLRKIKNPGTWGLFGGEVNKQETTLDGLKRELTEELNLTIEGKQKLKLIKKNSIIKIKKIFQ